MLILCIPPAMVHGEWTLGALTSHRCSLMERENLSELRLE